MPSQWSAYARNHPFYDDSRKRDRDRARAELRQHMDACDRKRAMLNGRRILPAVESSNAVL